MLTQSTTFSRPADTFDYRNHFEYEYDNLEFNHQTIPQLENLLKQRQRRGRVFAGVMIHNIGLSADVEFSICVPPGPDGFEDCNHKVGIVWTECWLVGWLVGRLVGWLAEQMYKWIDGI